MGPSLFGESCQRRRTAKKRVGPGHGKKKNRNISSLRPAKFLTTTVSMSLISWLFGQDFISIIEVHDSFQPLFLWLATKIIGSLSLSLRLLWFLLRVGVTQSLATLPTDMDSVDKQPDGLRSKNVHTRLVCVSLLPMSSTNPSFYFFPPIIESIFL